MTEQEDDIFAHLYDDNSDNSSDVDDLNPLNLEDDDAPDHDDSDEFEMQGTFEIPEDEDEDDSDDDELQNNSNNSIVENELINEILLSKGIKDHKVIYENDEGVEEEVDFYTLPKEEQLAILNSSDSDINYGLDDHELLTVNFLRENNVTFEEAIEYFKKQAVHEYIDSQSVSGLQVDQYTDEELFVLDLKAKYDDFTEEELQIELDKQLEHPELFKKKIDKLRTEYKEIEDKELEDAKLQTEKADKEKAETKKADLITAAQSIEDIGGLELDINDKNEVLHFLLEKDINGVSAFDKALDSPDKLFELAWYAKKGKEAFDVVHDYYKKEIEKVRKNSYEKGKQEVSTSEKPRGKTFIRENGGKTTSPKQKILTIDDLTID